jgi:hypothetical protein
MEVRIRLGPRDGCISRVCLLNSFTALAQPVFRVQVGRGAIFLPGV